MGENLIVCLPTGSGKTFIATKLIEEYLPETNASLVDGGKRIIFLVKTGSFDSIRLFHNDKRFSFSSCTCSTTLYNSHEISR